MPYLVNIYFQAELQGETGKVFPSTKDAKSYAANAIKNIVKGYPEENQIWAQSCCSSVITPVEQTILPNYNLAPTSTEVAIEEK